MSRFDIVSSLSDALSLNVDVSSMSDSDVVRLMSDLNAATMGVVAMRQISKDGMVDVFVDTTGWSAEGIREFQINLLTQAAKTIEHIREVGELPDVEPIYADGYRAEATGDRVCWERGAKDKVCWERGGKK